MAVPPNMMPPGGAAPPPTPPDGGAPPGGPLGMGSLAEILQGLQSQIEVSSKEPPAKQRFKYGSKAHAELLTKLEQRRRAGQKMYNERSEAWDEVDNVMNLAVDLTQGAHLSDHTKDTDKLEHPWSRGIVVPMTFAMTTVRLSQELSIFNSRDPQIQFAGRNPEDVDGAKLLDGVVAYDLRCMNFPMFQYQSLWDAERYGVCIAYDTFEREFGSVPRKRESSMLMPMLGEIEEDDWVMTREYNRYQNVDPRKFFYDPRVSIGRLQEAEFAGHDQVAGFIYVWERAEEQGGPYFNVDAVKKNCGSPGFAASNALASSNTPESTSPMDELDRGTYRISHMQIRLVPREWSKAGIPLGDSNRPEVWWFTWIDGKVIVRAHKSKYAHSQLTYAAAETVPDLHSYTNLGMIERSIGLQYAINWSVNSHIQAVRRMINNALLYCPSAIDETDLTNPRPGGHIRLIGDAEEKVLQGRMPISAFIQQLQYQDMTSSHFSDMGQISEMMQRMFAANDPVQGLPLQDKRTLGEVQAIMGSASQRIATTARLIDYQYNRPLAERHSRNRQQHTTKEQYYRIDGELAYEIERRFMDDKRVRSGRNGLQVLLGAEDIAGDFDYIPITANDPNDPSKDPQVWQQFAQMLQQAAPTLNNPQMYQDQMVPDMREVWSETIRRMGIKNVSQFFKKMPLPPPQPPQGGPPGGPGGPGDPGGPPGMPTGVSVVSDEQFQRGVEAGNYVPQGGGA